MRKERRKVEPVIAALFWLSFLLFAFGVGWAGRINTCIDKFFAPPAHVDLTTLRGVCVTGIHPIPTSPLITLHVQNTSNKNDTRTHGHDPTSSTTIPHHLQQGPAHPHPIIHQAANHPRRHRRRHRVGGRRSRGTSSGGGSADPEHGVGLDVGAVPRAGVGDGGDAIVGCVGV